MGSIHLRNNKKEQFQVLDGGKKERSPSAVGGEVDCLSLCGEIWADRLRGDLLERVGDPVVAEDSQLVLFGEVRRRGGGGGL